MLSWLLRAGRVPDAAELAEAAIAKHPDNQNLLQHYFRVISEVGDTQTVLRVAARLLKKFPRDRVFLMRLAAWLRAHDLDEYAERIYKSLIRISSAQLSIAARVHYGYGLLLLKQKRYPEAIGQFTCALGIDDEYDLTHASLAEALIEQGRYSEAEQNLCKRLRAARTKGKPQAVLQKILGKLYLRREEWPKALVAFTAARAEGDDYFGVYWGIGRALKELGRTAEAIEALQVALEQVPDERPAVRQEIETLLEEGRERL